MRQILTHFIFLYISRKQLTMRNIPDNNLSYPVFIQLDNGGTGSAFLFDALKKRYLVTAKHVIFDARSQKLHGKSARITCQNDNVKSEQVFIFNLDLSKLALSKRIICHPSSDVCVIHLFDEEINSESPNYGRLVLVDGVTHHLGSDEGIFISISLENIILFDDVLVSNDVYLYGYPTSLGLSDHKQFNPNAPLLRKGIVAGLNRANKSIILDCAVYFGNSGGPVIQVEDLNNGTFSHKIIGVVSEYVPFQENWVNSRNGAVNTQVSNSGYSVAVSMDKVIETLGITKDKINESI